MKVILISTFAHPIALGLRYVSSYLKAAGHEVEMIFMCSRRDTARADFSDSAIDALIERCRDAGLIGMSVITSTFHRACMLTERLREAGIGAPAIWGGTHPTVAPDESLEVADMICMGEGEEPMLQLVQQLEAGKDPTDVRSIAFRAGGPFGNRRTVRNAVWPLETELDNYPFPDYELHTHWVIEDGRLVQACPDNLRGALHRLRVLSTRGCPNRCTFCNNAALLEMYKGKGKWVRKRSNDNVVTEIEKARACFPTIEAINIVDDLFFVRGEDEIDDFVLQYKRRVNLPLELDAFPNTVTEHKIASLARLPIALISMGIQSASPDTLRNIYKRPTSIDKIKDSIGYFHKYGIKAEYHYIISNPYEPEENVIETMRFAASYHKRPAILRVFPLMFYPGTPLYERARSDGLIGPQHEEAYQHVYSGRLQFAKHDYLSTWLRVVLHMRNVGLPPWLAHRLVDVVTSAPVRWCLDRKFFMPLAFVTYQVLRKIYRNLIYQPFVRPIKHLRHRLRRKQRRPEEQSSSLTRDLIGIDEIPLPSHERSSLGAEPAQSRPASESVKDPRPGHVGPNSAR
jgi:radical SAM superfamily enzyme YgiQ (UPF0313 family)